MIVCGNKNYGLAEAIHRVHPDALFASRSTGWNFRKKEDIEKFAVASREHSIFISCSALDEFRQTLILQKVIGQWKAYEHAGRIVVLGSSADTPVKGTDWLYPIEKKAIRAYCRNLGNMCIGGQEQKPQNFRITYLSVGNLNTPKTNEKYPHLKKLDLSYIASVIDWICQQPIDVNINEMSIDPIQLR